MGKNSKRLKRTIRNGDGNPCPKCRKKMGRFEHGPTWKPKKDQPYYFQYWDKCASCSHIQHYEAAKIPVIEEDVDAPRDELTEEFRRTMT